MAIEMTIDRLKGYYDQLRKALPLHVKDGFGIAIAGGCVRDTLLKRPIKDIDIMIEVRSWYNDPHETEEDIDYIVEQLDKLFFTKGQCKSAISVESRRGRYSGSHMDLASVWGWEHGFNDYPVDVLFVAQHPSDEIKEQFDFGICQAWVGFYGLETTRAFWKDQTDKTITYLRKDGVTSPAQLEACGKHATRLLAKYPGWKLLGISAV